MGEEKGSALIQWIVIGGVISLIIFFSGMAVTDARRTTRDYKRLSDVSRIQAALELYFNENNEYPKSEEGIALGRSNALCLSTGGFGSGCNPGMTSFLNPVPFGTSIGVKSGFGEYVYVGDGESYVISFYLEKDVALNGVGGGVVCANSDGFVSAGSASCSLK